MSTPLNGSKILLVVEGEHPEERVLQQAESLRAQFPGTQVDVTWDMQDPRIKAYQDDRQVVMIMQPSAKGKSYTQPDVNPLLKALQAAPTRSIAASKPAGRHPFQRFIHGRRRKR